MCSNGENILYADDTVLVHVGTNLDKLTDHVNSRLRNILVWCNCNRLSWYALKSEFTVVTYKRIETNPQLFIGADQTKEVILTKFLNFEAAKNIYKSFIHSVTTYSIGVRGGVSQCTPR